MEIQIDENYKLGSDAYNWIIYKRINDNKTGGYNWQAHKFYSTPGAALMNLANKLIRESEATTFLEAVEEVNKIKEKFDKLLLAYNLEKYIDRRE